MHRQPIISASGLVKTFTVGKRRKGMLGSLRGLADRGGEVVHAVEGISFSIQPGEMVGYIGPNGAGKSTTIKMLTGILVPSSGQATVAGLTPWENRRQLAAQIGVVFGQRTQLWWDLPLIESLELLQYMYRVPADRFRHNFEQAIELLDLGPTLNTPVRQLSLGQRMRGDLAAAILHEPPILYLDEPTIGLDLVAKARIREFLAERNAETGVTLLLTTHDLADIERLCSRIIVIDHGRIMYDGPLTQVRDRFGAERQLVVDFDEAPIVSDSLPGNLRLVSQDGPRVRVAFARQHFSAPEVLSLMGTYGNVRDMAIEETSIEEIIAQIYAGATAA